MIKVFFIILLYISSINIIQGMEKQASLLKDDDPINDLSKAISNQLIFDSMDKHISCKDLQKLFDKETEENKVIFCSTYGREASLKKLKFDSLPICIQEKFHEEINNNFLKKLAEITELTDYSLAINNDTWKNITSESVMNISEDKAWETLQLLYNTKDLDLENGRNNLLAYLNSINELSIKDKLTIEKQLKRDLDINDIKCAIAYSVLTDHRFVEPKQQGQVFLEFFQEFYGAANSNKNGTSQSCHPQYFLLLGLRHAIPFLSLFHYEYTKYLKAPLLQQLLKEAKNLVVISRKNHGEQVLYDYIHYRLKEYNKQNIEKDQGNEQIIKSMAKFYSLVCQKIGSNVFCIQQDQYNEDLKATLYYALSKLHRKNNYEQIHNSLSIKNSVLDDLTKQYDAIAQKSKDQDKSDLFTKISELQSSKQLLLKDLQTLLFKKNGRLAREIERGIHQKFLSLQDFDQVVDTLGLNQDIKNVLHLGFQQHFALY